MFQRDLSRYLEPEKRGIEYILWLVMQEHTILEFLNNLFQIQKNDFNL